jgi:FtsH-binding integral membrane protein
MFSDSVNVQSVSRSIYYFVIGAVLTWGFLLTGILSSYTETWLFEWPEFILVMVIALMGIFVSHISDHPLVSFLGFNMVVAPLGAMLGPCLAHYSETDPGIVGEAALITSAISMVMAGSGFLFPKFYESIGGALLGSLGALCLVSIATLFFPVIASYTMIHYFAAGLFSLFIGYDMHKASAAESTLGNAVKAALDLYLSILNLFLRVLQILSSSRD